MQDAGMNCRQKWCHPNNRWCRTEYGGTNAAWHPTLVDFASKGRGCAGFADARRIRLEIGT